MSYVTTDKTLKESKHPKAPKKDEQSATYGQSYQSQPYYRPYNNYQYNKLYRSTRDKWIAGVCGGIAEHFNKDPILIRFLWIALIIVSAGAGLLAYLAFWIFVEKYPSYYALPPQPTTSGEPRQVHYH